MIMMNKMPGEKNNAKVDIFWISCKAGIYQS
jgi:hypothetical protein